jgi:hypothetical protein
MSKCKVEGCEKEICKGGMCRRHHNQIYKYGKIIGNPSKSYRDSNSFVEEKNCVKVITNDVWGNDNGCFLLDKKDWKKMKQHKWSFDNLGYPTANIKGKATRLHKLLVNYERTDHKNRDRSDNRRENLRECSSFQNAFNKGKRKDNKTGFKGIHKRESGFYLVQIGFEKKQIYLGTYPNITDAIKAYDEAAKKYHKDFACLNPVLRKRKGEHR